MIVEVRSYRIKPGHREEFIKLFETRAVPVLRAHGMKVFGPLLDVENPNKFVWLRMFPSLSERDRMIAERGQRRSERTARHRVGPCGASMVTLRCLLDSVHRP